MAANSIQVTGTPSFLTFILRYPVRVRPLNTKQSLKDLWPCGRIGDGSVSANPQTKLSTKGIRRVVQVVDDRVLVFDPPEENPIAQYSKTMIAGGRKTKDMRYAFDHVFDETCTQEDVPP